MRYEILDDLQTEETTTVGIVTQPKHIVRQGYNRTFEKALACTSR
jgi:hypothetical protein